MTSYTTKSAYPYPDPGDPVSDYPTTAQSFANYLDNLPNRNRIINGQFDIWQRGTSFSNPATGAYTADRWAFTHNGTGGTRIITRENNPAGTTIGGMQARHFLAFSVTNAGSPAASSQTIGQRIEDVRTFAGEAITISAWVKASILTSVTVKAIQNFGTGGSPSAAVTTTLGTATGITSSWVRRHVHVTLPTISGKTIGTDENSYLEIQFDIGGATGRLDIWGVQVEQGTTFTAIERRSIQNELADCERYFQIIAEGQLRGTMLNASGVSRAGASLRTVMRAAPVVTINGTFSVWDGSGAGSFSSLSTYYSNTRAVEIEAATTAPFSAVNRPSIVYINTGAELRCNAEL